MLLTLPSLSTVNSCKFTKLGSYHLDGYFKITTFFARESAAECFFDATPCDWALSRSHSSAGLLLARSRDWMLSPMFGWCLLTCSLTLSWGLLRLKMERIGWEYAVRLLYPFTQLHEGTGDSIWLLAKEWSRHFIYLCLLYGKETAVRQNWMR